MNLKELEAEIEEEINKQITDLEKQIDIEIKLSQIK